MIRRVLIANRGEIARRVMRSCRDMGIATVAIYSDADADAPHVHEADAAERVGPAGASESYLNIPAVVDAARRSGADAIHPGYGFLSENAAFAQACADAGLTFVGPPPDVIRRMGSKTASRETVSAAGVPVVPGGTPSSQSAADIARAVRETGLPALLKAAAGGGGKGMRIVRREDEIDDAIAAAASEAQRAFGDGSLYVERLVEKPRHIEVQVFGDTHGNVVHLFERDCSLQRRHQKVIEEAPAPHLAPGVRARLLEAAVTAARAVNYVNAGTIEFLLDGHGEDARFYFLEMNTRLQVEHPVTEAITGLDLVRAQLLVASGGPLPFRQSDITVTGHAAEARVYAEDSRTLLPQAGRILLVQEPSLNSVRIDTALGGANQSITVHYDPLLSKVIAHAPSRADALDVLARALATYDILGVRHNIAFLLRLLDRSEVRAGETYTRFIDDFTNELTSPPPTDLVHAAVAVAARGVADRRPGAAAPPDEDSNQWDPWDHLGPVRWH